MNFKTAYDILHTTYAKRRTKHASCHMLYAICFFMAVSTAEAAPVSREYRVQSVIDGDTIVVANNAKVRYIGIDTPELRKRRAGEWVFDPEPFATQAQGFNKSLVFGKNIRLEFDKERKDKYGRLLAYVFVDGKMANMELVREGLASVYTFPPNIKYIDEFILAQDQARLAKKGIWQNIKNINPSQIDQYIGKYCIIEAQVFDVKISRKGIFLKIGTAGNFATLVIHRRNIELFSRKGIDPTSDYTGKILQVFGKVKDYGFPQIIIDNPSQLQIKQ